MTVAAPTLPRVEDLLGRVRVDLPRRRAVVDGERIEAADVLTLRRDLSNLLYEVLHAGHRVRAGTLPFRLRDPVLERQLGEATPHRTTRARARRLAPADGFPAAPGRELVERDGVRVWMPAESVVGAPGELTLLEVGAARPAVSPGFYLVDSSVSRPPADATLRLYLHLTDADAAVLAWHRVLSHLERHGVGYRAKVLSARALYPRRDALVVYLPADDSTAAITDGIADVVTDLPGLGADTSCFARRLAPGVASAWEPDDPRGSARGLSFGQHRASTVGRALVEAALSGTAPLPSVVEACDAANVDPTDLSRNHDSPDRTGLPARCAAPAVPRVRTPD